MDYTYVVSFCIAYGADTNIENSDGWTALHFAAYCPNFQDFSKTKLFSSKRKKENRKQKQLDMIRLLLAHGANPISKSHLGKILLSYII